MKAARIFGTSDLKIMFTEILPNCMAPLIIQITLGFSDGILNAATALSFLGLGAQPPTAEWGIMLSDSRAYIESSPWMVTLPGLCILSVVLGFNLLGDGLRDILDPRLKKDRHLLRVKNLNIKFKTTKGIVTAVKDVSFSLDRGETLGVVGESGCGKSITNIAIMGLLPPEAIVTAEELSFDGKSLLKLSQKEWQLIRGPKIGMIFQDPMSALNPCFTIEKQLAETIQVVDRGIPSERVKQKSIELLSQVGIPSPESRLKCYPHELSGGMAQRVMIAMAVAAKPQLLIADEPTTALDVTIQLQILKLLHEIQKEK